MAKKIKIRLPEGPLTEVDIKKRECLRCEKKFKSKNRFNRLCTNCKESSDYQNYSDNNKLKEK